MPIPLPGSRLLICGREIPPAGSAGYRPGPNDYEFARSSPCVWRDPLGLEVAIDGKDIPGTEKDPRKTPPLPDQNPLGMDAAEGINSGGEAVQGHPYRDEHDRPMCAGEVVIGATLASRVQRGWVQYYRATIEWGDPYQCRVGVWTNDMQDGGISDNPVSTEDDQPGNNPWYTGYGEYANPSTGYTTTAMWDHPGWPNAPLERADSEQGVATLTRLATGRADPSALWARLSYEFVTCLVDVSTRRVVECWTWTFWIRFDPFAATETTTGTSTPLPVGSLDPP